MFGHISRISFRSLGQLLQLRLIFVKDAPIHTRITSALEQVGCHPPKEKHVPDEAKCGVLVHVSPRDKRKRNGQKTAIVNHAAMTGKLRVAAVANHIMLARSKFDLIIHIQILKAAHWEQKITDCR